MLADGTDLDALDASIADGRVDAETRARLADLLVREVVEEQVAAGIALVSDGQVRHRDLVADVATALRAREPRPERPIRSAPLVLDEWRFAADITDHPVKQAMPGPYTLGRVNGGSSRERSAWTLAAAEALRDELSDLAGAGCPFVEVHEPAAVDIGADEHERRLFRDAHERLVDGVSGTHLSLVLLGGEVEPAGVETLLAAPYASLALDLIGGPDGWRVIARAPRERGVVCGVMPTGDGQSGDLALMVWAAQYAASTAGRGLDRVGIATAGGLAGLGRSEAAQRLSRLAEAARLAVGERTDDLAAALGREVWDPSADDLRPAKPRRILRGLPSSPVPGRPPRPRRGAPSATPPERDRRD